MKGFTNWIRGTTAAVIGCTLALILALAVTPNSQTFQQSFGWIGVGKLLFSSGTPTISSGFGTSPSINSSNGNTTFRVDVGTGGSASSGVIAMGATASTGWNCIVVDPTAAKETIQTSNTTTSVTVTGYETTGTTATAWTASTVLKFVCAAY